MKPRVWFNKNFSPIIHVLQEIAPHTVLFTSHTSADSPMLYGDWQSFSEPSGLVGSPYLEYALQICADKNIDLFIPSKEAGFLSRHLAAFAAIGTRVVTVANHQTLKHLEDKAAFYKAFPDLRVCLPQTLVVDSWQELQAAVAQMQARGHLVCIKPAIGTYGYGFRLITAQEQLSDFLKGDTHRISMRQAEHIFANAKKFVTMLVMEFLPGREFSVDCLAQQGVLVGAVVREKIGGLGNVQTVCGSLANPELHDMVVALTSHYQLNGIFNAQFKTDQQGKACLLEINARPSGGLRFSMAGGFSFGLNLVGLELGSLQITDIAPPSRQTIRVTETKQALVLA